MRTLLLTLCLLPLMAGGQTLFKDIHGGSLTNYSNHVQLSNNDFLVASRTTDNPVGGEDILLVRTTENGDTVWLNTYGGPHDDHAEDIVELPDGSLLVAFHYYSGILGYGNIGLMKVDANGTLLWANEYGANLPTSASFFEDFRLLDISGDYYLYRWMDSSLIQLEVDANGNVLSQSHWNFGPNAAGFVEKGQEHDLMILTSEPGTFNRAGVIEMDVDGTIYDIVLHQHPSDDLVPFKIYPAHGEYYLINYHPQGFQGTPTYHVSRMDTNLTIQWTSQVGQVLFSGGEMTLAFCYDSIYVQAGGDIRIADTSGTFHRQYATNAIGTGVDKLMTDASGQLTFGGEKSLTGNRTAFGRADSQMRTGSCSNATELSYSAVSLTYTPSVAALPTLGSDTLSSGSLLMLQFPSDDYRKLNLEVQVTSENVQCKDACDGWGFADVIGGEEPFNVVWDNSVIGQTNANICPGQYICLVTDALGCSFSDTIQITEPDSLLMTINSVGAEYCGGDTVSVGGSATGGTTPYSYGWSPLTGVICDTCLNTQIETWMPETYVLTITDSNNCIVSDSIYLNTSVPEQVDVCVASVDSTSTMNLVVWQKPVTDNIDYFNVYRDVIGTWLYIGSVDYDSLSQFADTTFGVDPNVTSYIYSITTVDSCGNESDHSPSHQTMHVTQNQGTGNEINLIWTNYQGIGFIFYRILRDTTGANVYTVLDSVTATNTTYTDPNPPNGNTSYMIEIVLPMTCFSTHASHNTTRSNRTQPIGGPTGIASSGMISDFNLYPNPAQDQLTLSFTTALDHGSGDLKMYSSDGRLLTNRSLSIGSGSNTIREDVSQLPAGVYFLSIEVAGVVERVRFVKM